MKTTERKVFILLNSKRTIERFNQVTAMTDAQVDTEYETILHKLETQN